MNKTNEYIKRKWGHRSQIDLAKAIAEKRGGKDTDYKSYVNKWFKTDQEPGKDYLIVLSEILNVSIESILRGEDVANNDIDRPTSYLAAKSGDETMINHLFGNKLIDIRVTTSDEYGKSFLDYAFEFENYQAIKTVINNGFLKISIFGSNGYFLTDEQEEQLANMIVNNDDVVLFQRMFARSFPFLSKYKYENLPDSQRLYTRYQGIPKSLCKKILNGTSIFEYFLASYPFSRKEYDDINKGTYVNGDDIFEEMIKNIPSLHAGFNTLINEAIERELSDKLNKLLDASLICLERITNVLENDIEGFYVTQEKLLKFGHIGITFAFLPYVEKVSLINNEKTKEKALKINNIVNNLIFK